MSARWRIWLPRFVVAVAGAAAFGLFLGRTLPAVLYKSDPALVDAGRTWLVVASGATFVLLLALGAFRLAQARRSPNLAALFIAGALPLLALGAAFLRPFPDVSWSQIVAVSAGLAVFAAAWRHGVSSGRSGSSLSKRWQGLAATLAPLLSAALSFAIYLRTLAPSVVEGDSAEFQTVGYTLGISHPTGYPLYLLLAKAFTFLPFGNVAYRINLLSAVFAAAAVYLVVCAGQRLSGDGRAALVGGLVLSFSGLFWSQAVIAELYALNAFLVALLLYLMVRGVMEGGEVKKGTLRPYLLWLALGLGLAHHRTILLLGPAILGYVLVARSRALLKPRALAAAAILVAVPLALYLYLPIRWPIVNGEALSWERFQWHVLASDYSFALQPQALLGEPERLAYFVTLLVDQVGIAAMALGTIGLLILAVSRAKLAALAVLSFSAFVLFPVAYRVPDAAVFAIPAVLVFTLWFTAGLAFTIRHAERLLLRFRVAGGGELVLAFGLLIPGALLISNFAPNDLSQDWWVDRWGRSALEQDVPQRAIVVADIRHMSALRYFYGVEAPERQAIPLMPDAELVARAIVSDTVAAGRTTYLARYLPGLETRFHLSAPGPLVAVSREALPPAPPAVSTQITVTNGIYLVGYTRGPASTPAGADWPLALFWRLPQKVADSHYVHLQLVDGEGRVVFSNRPAVPVAGLYPTWAWRADEVVADYREVALPIDLMPGRYRLEVGFGGAYRLPERWVDLGGLEVTAPRRPVPMRGTLAVYDERLALVGYRQDGQWRPGSKVKVGLQWEGLGKPGGTLLSVTLDLVDDAGRAYAHAAEALSPVAAPTWYSFYDLPLPRDLPAGTYRTRVRLTNDVGATVPVRTGWPAVSRDAILLDDVTVDPAPAESLTNLEGKAILVRREIERDVLRPGEVLRLTLYWRAVTKIDENYTVFVHLLDGAPRVRAQVDSFPAGGLRPTSQWRAGELVADSYQLALPADLAPGDYQVEVGMYQAATMQRLQVVDADDRPIDDRVMIGPVRIQ